MDSWGGGRPTTRSARENRDQSIDDDAYMARAGRQGPGKPMSSIQWSASCDRGYRSDHPRRLMTVVHTQSGQNFCCRVEHRQHVWQAQVRSLLR